ncbi:MAG TPA: hypothetical protein VF062_11765 [Candidatus Limnocylindrales bacterium]
MPLDSPWARALLWVATAACLAQALVTASTLPEATNPEFYDSWRSNGWDLAVHIGWSVVSAVMLAIAAAILPRHPAGARALAYPAAVAVLIRSCCAYPNLTWGIDDGGPLVRGVWVYVEVGAAFVGPLALVAAIPLLRRSC